MKRDGRTLDHKTLEEIRLMAVQRVWEGERPSVVIASYGFARPVIYRWLREARGKGRGLRALRSRKGTGRPRRLAPKQEQQVFRWINGKDPRQHGFDFGLWTRLVVRKLIADKFGVNFGVTAVGKSSGCSCRLLPRSRGLPQMAGGSASALSLSRPASGKIRIDATEAVEARLRTRSCCN